MITNKIRGEVTLIVRDVNTEEIIHKEVQENIITESLYFRLRDTWQLGFNIVISNAYMESSRFTHMFPGSGAASTVTQFPSRIIPAVGAYSTYVPEDGTNTQYVQFSGRFDAPAIGSSRVINSVGLGAHQGSFYTPTTSPQTDNQYLTYNTSSPLNVMAFLKLNTTCTQTDQQVLDVYYRLFFPFESGTNNIPKYMYDARFVQNDWTTSNYGSFPNSSRNFVFKLPVPKAGDENLTMIPYRCTYHLGGTLNNRWTLGTLTNSTTLLGAKTTTFTDANFADYVGTIINTNVYMSNTPTYYSSLKRSTKINNLIGTATESTNPLSPSFLDVDNLPTGTGKIYLGGSWNNIGTPSSPGLYYPAVLPEYNRIKITTSGNVGISKYKLIKQKFFGYMIKNNTGINSYYRYTDHTVPPLCGSAVDTAYDYGKSLIEDISQNYFSTQQLSSCCRFDDSSIVFVKKNKIILYNVAAADYWKYTASYSDIHQVAVMNNKIYVACRATGLWVIDPYNSLTPVSLASPGSGIDLSICNGVAKGYGNNIWAVANNCIAKFDGTTWTKYDSTTTPAFSMTGISDNNWSNVEYIKVDEDSTAHQMLLVRKYNASVNASLLGVWWSTAGLASNTGAETATTSTNCGRPRVHRGHVGGLGGHWIVLAQNQWYRTTFGSSSFNSMTNVTAFQHGTNQSPAMGFQSATFVKNNQGQVRTWHVDNLSYFSLNSAWSVCWLLNQKTIDNTNTIIENYSNAVSGLSIPWFHLLGYDIAIPGYYGNVGSAYFGSVYIAASSTQGTYPGGRDLAHNFILAPGVMVMIHNDDFSVSAPNSKGVSTRLMNFGLDYTQGGGPMNYVAQTEYGWNGTNWELNNPNEKPTHSTEQELVDGVTVRFEDGSAGTSFSSGNLYKFGLCEGLLKDNATRATYSATPYYIRKTTSNVTDLESNTVPALRNGSTGIVGIDTYNCSANVTVNGSGEVLFPGQNVRQYAVGDKPLIGDFVLSIDVANLNATDVKNAACIGVTRRDYVNSGMQYFGFICSAGVLYSYDNGTTASIATIAAGTTTSLEIRRVGSTLSLWRNGASVKTMTGTGIRAADYILDVLYGVWDHRDTTYLPSTGTRVPKATITSNGSAIYVNMGNSTTRTGCYSNRFYGIDFVTTGASTVTMDGSTITPKIDGTAPSAGQITVDHWRGVMYFNSADIGKTLSASYLHLNS